MQTDTITLRELTIRYAPKTDVEGQPVVVGRALTTPAECGSVLVKLLQDQPGEVFAILCMSTKHRVIAYHEVSRGTLDATLVHPRLCSAQHNAEHFLPGGCIPCTPSTLSFPTQHKSTTLVRHSVKEVGYVRETVREDVGPRVPHDRAVRGRT